MSLQVLEVLKEGLKKTFSTSGLKLIGAFYALSIVGQIANDSLIAHSGGIMGGVEATPLAAVSVPTPVIGGLLMVSLLANLWLAIGALRNLVNENFESLDKDYFRENLTMPALNMIGGSIVFSLAVLAGLVAFVVPGVFLMVSLIFWSIFVAVENENFIDGLKNSWELSKGNRIDLFLIGVGLFMIGVLASALVALPNIALATVSPAASALLSLLTSAFGTVLGLVTLAHTYNELQ
jgi:hypothetical protein